MQLGLHHEQQHQELLLMDIKAILFSQPGKPAYKPETATPKRSQASSSLWRKFAAGVYEIGALNYTFAYDNELPRHKIYCEDFELRESLVSNGEFLEFIEDGQYQSSKHWLSDGWNWLQKEKIAAPLYWTKTGGSWVQYGLSGLQELDLHQPVTHVSYYEAAAFAKWKNCRLPTEAEWEVAFHREPCSERWQWTQSSYLPYPGFRPFAGTFAEYNGKFMSGQMVLRGGSALTPKGHYRSTYRNYFHPEMRWQYSGIRLAK